MRLKNKKNNSYKFDNIYENYLIQFISIIVFLILATRVLYFSFSADRTLIGVIPDDAFYYFEMAKNRYLFGFWSFDLISTATGFHLLYGYLLFCFFSLFGVLDWHVLFMLIGTLSALSISFSAYLVGRVVKSYFGISSVPVSMALFVTPISISLTTNLMESWLILPLSAATIYLISSQEKLTKFNALLIFLIGIFGSLARSDYGMLPGALVGVFLISYIFTKQGKQHIKRAFLILSGSIVGVLMVLLHNLITANNLFQSSAKIKLLWSSVNGHSFAPPLDLISHIFTLPFFQVYSLNLKIAFAGLCLFFLILNLKKKKSDNLEYCNKFLIFFGCLFTVIGYIFFYRNNSMSLQTWYSANFIPPLAICTAFVFNKVYGAYTLIPSLAAFILFIAIGTTNIFNVPYAHQAGMYQSALYLRNLSGDHFYGSWNAGILRFFSGKRIVNIDGLANDDVYDYIKSNDLFQYLKLKNIEYIADYKAAILNEGFRKKGGYNDPEFLECLNEILPIDGESPNFDGTRFTLFKIQLPCK
jgi:hypothetical protein